MVDKDEESDDPPVEDEKDEKDEKEEKEGEIKS
jgi:hypothetical protein